MKNRLLALALIAYLLAVLFFRPHATPGPQLVQLSLALCNLYLIEHAPVRADTIRRNTAPEPEYLI